MSFLTDDGINSILSYDIILGFIACIKIEVLPFVLLFDKGFYDIRVVYACVCRMVFLYEFGLLVCLDVILVTIVLLTTFLCPSGINVLVRLFG